MVICKKHFLQETLFKREIEISSQYDPSAEITLFSGDVRNLIEEIPDKSVSLIITSPPYNLGKEYETKVELSNYIKTQSELVNQFVRILKDDGRSMAMGKNKLVGLIFLIPLLAACSSAAPETALPLPTAPATQTEAPTEIPSPTPTPDINELPIDEVLRLLINSEIEYPTEFDDTKRAELAIAIANYFNENVVADEVYVPLYFEEVGDIKVGWDPEAKRWRSDHNAAEFIDFTGDSLPQLIVPGYTNQAGQEVFINQETGKESIVPKIEMPGLGELSITELYAMGQIELREYSVDLMLGAEGLREHPDSFNYSYINDLRLDRYYLPMIIYESAQSGDHIYHTIFRAVTPYSQVPEANASFVDTPTNSVLIPIIDQISGQILFWINILQGIQNSSTYATRFFSSGEANYNSPKPFTIVPDREDQLFGADTNHSFGILVPGKTTEITYDIHGAKPLLEGGVGIGSAEQLAQLINQDLDLKGYLTILDTSNLRLLVLYPDIEIHQSVEK